LGLTRIELEAKRVECSPEIGGTARLARGRGVH
jgi:hypothetical protein